MLNVDFSRARLHWVEFRGIALDHVLLPNDTDHIIIDNFASVLDKLISTLKQNPDKTTKGLIAALQTDRKWAPPRGRGLLNRQDFVEGGNEEAAEYIVDLLRQLGARTSLNSRIN